MGDKVKFLLPETNGQSTETTGESMEIIEAKEPWAEYILEDGAKIRAKQVVMKIVKLNQKNPDGTPVYILQGHPMMFVIPKL
ncbi:MAG: hypothetical protein LBC51_00650 [Treponema sp.]|jgi:hypothetical protein|nr:hypothetical protein [Treponema sp.]